MSTHTLMLRFASEAKAASFEQWLHQHGHAETSVAGGDVTVSLHSSVEQSTVRSEAERVGGEVAWDEDDGEDLSPDV